MNIHSRSISKRHVATLVVLTMWVSWFLFPHTVVAAEIINSFTSEITPVSDGSMLVTETIVYDFGSADRHGIFRTLPTEHPQPASAWYKDRYIKYEITSVLRDDNSEPYVINREGSDMRVRIGDPDLTITGSHTYQITYKVTGALFTYETQPPEIYWNVTGDGWPVAINQASATIKDPNGLTGELRDCYVGRVGSEQRCQQILVDDGEVTFLATNLASGEGLTVAQSLQIGRTATPVLEKLNAWVVILPIVLTVILVLSMAIYHIKTRHKLAGPVIAQYKPFKRVLPMYTGVLMDGRLDPKDITAGIIYLAEQGFLKIKKTEQKVLYFFAVDDYEVTLVKDRSEAPTRFHYNLIDLLFKFATPGMVTKLSELKEDTSHKRANHKLLTKLRKSIAEDLIERGFYEHIFSIKQGVWLAAAALVFTVMTVGIVTYVTGAFELTVPFIFIEFIGIIVIASVLLYRRRTRLGYEALQHIKGFKEFLSVTGKERFKFHNSPSKSPEQFIEYLPYAVALGVEEEWAEVFEDITIPEPEWYQSNTDISTFNATALTQDLGAFSTAFASSSGASGSSGSGSSGGGAGGGGGGSW